MIIPAIEARNVSKVLGAGAGQVRALKNIDLSIAGGKLTVLMGPSGSGKTTLLSISAACWPRPRAACSSAGMRRRAQARSGSPAFAGSTSGSFFNLFIYFRR